MKPYLVAGQGCAPGEPDHDIAFAPDDDELREPLGAV
jgi:hypothetical protein